eukprot:COSAG03_NODE_3384_length_2048_cov_3.873268_3_plen_61_part_00
MGRELSAVMQARLASLVGAVHRRALLEHLHDALAVFVVDLRTMYQVMLSLVREAVAYVEH